MGDERASRSPASSSVRARLAHAQALDSAVGEAGSSLSAGDATAVLAACTEAQAASESSMASAQRCIDRNQKALSASQDLERRWEDFQKSFQNMMNAMVEKIGESIRADPKGAAAALGVSARDLSASGLATHYEHEEIDFGSMLAHVRAAKKIVFLTGAGISVSSGIPTYRGAEGTWTMGSENYTPQEIATHSMYSSKTSKCWSYFTDRWKMCLEARPNAGHNALVELENLWASTKVRGEGDGPEDSSTRSFTLISQNIDNLHHRAGSTNLLEIHGNMKDIRCLNPDCSRRNVRLPRTLEAHGNPEKVPTCSECGAAMRPHVLFFDECYSEELYRASSAQAAVSDADLLVVVGTMCCTSLPNRIVATAARKNIPVIDINPNKNDDLTCAPLLQYVAKSDDALPELVAALRSEMADSGVGERDAGKLKQKQTKH